MHKEILSPEQINLLHLISRFKKEFYLVGGTAIALHIGHRRSIDFDLFKRNEIKPKSIIECISALNFTYTVTRRVTEQLNLNINNVKISFFQYPYPIKAAISFDDYLRMPTLIDLAAMKAFALGRRSKWKDYVDLYFILKDHFTISQISERAKQVYDQLFSEKLFRVQLTYFDDIDYSEPIEILGPEIPEDEIRAFLVDQATDLFG